MNSILLVGAIHSAQAGEINIGAGENTIAPWVVSLHGVEVGDAAGNGNIVGPAFELFELSGDGVSE